MEEMKENSSTKNERTEEKKKDKIISKRYKLLSFKKIKEIKDDFIKSNELCEKDIDKFHKIFKLSDVDSEINFQYLSILKETDIDKFKKYINKYLYTLNYSQAKQIYPDIIIQEEKELNKIKIFRLENNINEEINEINSLSKIMLVNFIYQLNDYYKKNKDKNDFKNLVSEYKLNAKLKFRLPNFCGSKELMFYTYLQLFLEIFYFEDSEVNKMNIDELDENKIENGNNKKIITNEDDQINEIEECFSLSDWSYDVNKCFEFNDEEINNDINDFITLINNNNKIITMETMNKEEVIINKNFYDILTYLQYLNIFDIFIKEKIIKDFNNNDFLDKIDFIYHTINNLRFNNKDKELFLTYRNYFKYVLYEPKDVKEKSIKILNYSEDNKIYLKSLSEDIKERLIYNNLISLRIKDVINNPFVNCSLHYKFPFNMDKNIVLFDEEFYNDIKSFMLQVYESKLFKEIFYMIDEFKDFLYPFETGEKENIFNEMFENTKFYPFEFGYNYSNGHTNKIIPKIIINSIINDCSSLEKIIINFALIINTIFCEQLNKYIKILIYYNSLRLNLSSFFDNHENLNKNNFEKYLKIVQKKKEIINYLNISSDELKEIKESDIGDKFEILLYGQKLQQLYINGALDIIDIISYNKSISEHLIDFLDKNKSINMIELDEKKLQKIPLLQKLINFVKKYSLNKNIIKEYLDGNIAIQIASSATQIPGNTFMEFKRISVRNKYGTS